MVPIDWFGLYTPGAAPFVFCDISLSIIPNVSRRRVHPPALGFGGLSFALAPIHVGRTPPSWSLILAVGTRVGDEDMFSYYVWRRKLLSQISRFTLCNVEFRHR